jgi:hypothetical protein
MIGGNKIIISNDKNCKTTLKKVKLVKDGGYGYALDVTYTIETPECVQELNIPRVWLPIQNSDIQICTDPDYIYGGQECRADIGFGFQNIGFRNEHAFILTTIETKTKEMTLEEIEKKLGHKVKIVNR